MRDAVEVAGRAGAVHDPHRAQALRRPVAAAAEGELGGILRAVQAADAAGVEVEAPGGAGRLDAFGDGTGHPMAMHVPPGTQVAQKARLVLGRKRLPDVLGERPQPIHHGVPGAARRLRSARLRPQRAQQFEKRRRQRAHAGGGARSTGTAAIRARQEPAAGQRMDRPAVSLVEQGDDDVHHREAGADQQHRRLGVEPGKRLRRPGVGAVERPVEKGRLRSGRRLGREVADRQHGDVGRQPATAFQSHGEARLVLAQPDDVAAQQFQSALVLRPLHLLGQQVADIGAEPSARHEALRAGQGRVRPRRLLLQPFQEVAGPVTEGAHAAGRHVQQVVRVAGGIGLAPAEGAVALDERDADRRRTSAQKVQGEQGAAEAGTDDGDRRSCHPVSCRRMVGLPSQRSGEERRGRECMVGTRGVRATVSRALRGSMARSQAYGCGAPQAAGEQQQG